MRSMDCPSASCTRAARLRVTKTRLTHLDMEVSLSLGKILVALANTKSRVQIKNTHPLFRGSLIDTSVFSANPSLLDGKLGPPLSELWLCEDMPDAVIGGSLKKAAEAPTDQRPGAC